MKLFLALFTLLTSVVYSEQRPDAAWPPKDVAFVVAYCYDYIQDERGADPVFSDGSLHKGIIHSATMQLSDEQQKRLIQVVSTEVEFEESEDCYYPHHAFVFYDKNRKPVGWIGVCLSCSTYEFSSKNAPDYISYGELSKLCAELKLPRLFDSDGQGRGYTDLYREEQPAKERPNVVSFQQYLNRLNDPPIDSQKSPSDSNKDTAPKK